MAIALNRPSCGGAEVFRYDLAGAETWYWDLAANARLANEAFVRSDRLMMDWLTLADPRSGLLPRYNHMGGTW